MNAAAAAPRSYDQLHREWSPFVRKLGSRLGVASQDLEDFTSGVMVYCIERDSLSAYDPEVASFATFLRSYVVKRAFSYRRETRRSLSELALSPDAPISSEDPDSSREEVMAAPVPRYADWLVSESEIRRFHSHLLAVDPRLARLLVALCDEVVNAQTEMNRRIRLAKALSVSRSTVDGLMVKLEREARAAGFFDFR